MQVFSALKTDLSKALRTLDTFFIKGLAADEPFAVRLGAPAHQRITIYPNIVFVGLILFK